MTSKKNKPPQKAVSLKYKMGKDPAPKVTAKGQGLVAERIIALAREHKIPIKEDPDLLQVLSQVEVNQEVPPSIYQMIAELLAFIYKANNEYKSNKV
ncbi:MAG: flagellar biosynthesis protein FlhB [Nitrospina sp.]|nr:MAG: flagellar biosynthesis protein FlhB [Nitrospina sp.]